ncbi:MAG TPA: ROK family protein [Solirubrobacterales bacterium]|nr:ROK family protein [Solirubrobacterales bacterium]
MSRNETIGVDLGGTKMLVGVLGDGSAVHHHNLASSHGRSQEEVVDLLERELRAALAARPEVAAVGLGVPCTIDRPQGICVNAVNLPLADLPLRELVTERLGLPTSMDNDGNVAALAEQRHGAARGATNVVLLTIGTGIGGGLIIDGRPYRGSSGAGAELGHVVIEQDGPPCQGSCPNRGCVEALASGTALAREGLEAAQRHPDSALGALHREGREIDGREIVAAAGAGDEVAVEVLALIGRRIGVALSSFANTFDPDVILLGGGVMAAGELILERARSELRARALPPQNDVPVRAAALGERAGMIGAATLARDELEGVPAGGGSAR